MTPYKRSLGVGQWLRVTAAVAFLNILFLVVGMLAATLPREPLRDRVRGAFESGELVQEDYPRFDSRRGSHQYDECLILQMVTNPVDAPLRQAAGPIVHTVDMDGSDQCRTLYRLLVAGEPRSDFRNFRYTRYWHGHNLLGTLYLQFTSIKNARIILKIGVFGSLLLLLLVSIRREDSRSRSLGLSIGTFGLFFWGLPYFGQAFSHAPGDTILVMGLVGLLALPRLSWDHERLALYCAIYGTLIVYFEFMTGLLPTAAGLLFPAVYAARGTEAEIESREQWLTSTLALVAFGLGAGLTVALKLGLSAAVFGPGAFDSLLENLVYYTKPASSDVPLPRVLLPFGRLYRKGTALTYGSELGANLLFASAVGSWLAAASLAAFRRGRGRPGDLFAALTGALIVVIWILLFQTHTFGHAGFMVRMMIVPISLGWASLAWQVVREDKSIECAREQ